MNCPICGEALPEHREGPGPIEASRKSQRYFALRRRWPPEVVAERLMETERVEVGIQMHMARHQQQKGAA